MYGKVVINIGMYGECRNFLIRRDFTSNGARLRKRFMGLGVFMLVLSPFLLIFMLCYFFLRNAEQFYHEPSTAGSRRWSNLAKWTFREFNEVCSCVLILPFLWWNLN
jgi:autophagy-related protein 9